MDAEIARSSYATTSPPSTSSLLQTIDSFGSKLKPWALRAHEKSLRRLATPDGVDDRGRTRNDRIRAVLYATLSNALWFLYILYRGYRGFFVLLPAVFREVSRTIRRSDLVVDAFDDDDQGRPTKLRTRVTIAALSGALTLSYVISGACRVLGERPFVTVSSFATFPTDFPRLLTCFFSLFLETKENSSRRSSPRPRSNDRWKPRRKKSYPTKKNCVRR